MNQNGPIQIPWKSIQSTTKSRPSAIRFLSCPLFIGLPLRQPWWCKAIVVFCIWQKGCSSVTGWTNWSNICWACLARGGDYFEKQSYHFAVLPEFKSLAQRLLSFYFPFQENIQQPSIIALCDRFGKQFFTSSEHIIVWHWVIVLWQELWHFQTTLFYPRFQELLISIPVFHIQIVSKMILSHSYQTCVLEHQIQSSLQLNGNRSQLCKHVMFGKAYGWILYISRQFC